MELIKLEKIDFSIDQGLVLFKQMEILGRGWAGGWGGQILKMVD